MKYSFTFLLVTAALCKLFCSILRLSVLLWMNFDCVYYWMLVLFVTRHLETDSKKMYTLNLSQGAHPAGAYPGFHSMKGQGVLLLPPGWMVSSSQGSSHLSPPPAFHLASQTICRYLSYSWEEKGSECKFFCPRTHHNELARSWTQISQPGD